MKDPQHIYAKDAEAACAAMSYQYDTEEQAQDATMLADAELVPSVFIPLAPVALSFRWSPFPQALETLGPSRHFDTQQGATLAVFAPVAEPAATGSTPDERHFGFLLQHVCAQAIQANALVMLVGSPGWDYDSEDVIAEQPDLQRPMREFGFVCTHRKPLQKVPL